MNNQRLFLKGWILFVCLLLGMFTGAPLYSDAKEKPIYILAVPPISPPVELHKDWSPFLERVSKEVGVDIRPKIYKTISDYEDALLNGEPDFAFMNPYQAMVAKKSQGYLPLVRNEKPIKGIIVVRKDSPLKSIQELRDKEIAFPAPGL